MNEYLANKMCELIVSTTVHSVDEVKDAYKRTKSIDATCAMLGIA